MEPDGYQHTLKLCRASTRINKINIKLRKLCLMVLSNDFYKIFCLLLRQFKGRTFHPHFIWWALRHSQIMSKQINPKAMFLGCVYPEANFIRMCLWTSRCLNISALEKWNFWCFKMITWKIFSWFLSILNFQHCEMRVCEVKNVWNLVSKQFFVCMDINWSNLMQSTHYPILAAGHIVYCHTRPILEFQPSWKSEKP